MDVIYPREREEMRRKDEAVVSIVNALDDAIKLAAVRLLPSADRQDVWIELLNRYREGR